MPRTIFAALALLIGSTAAASAQTVQQVLRDVGLLGSWANDCSLPAAPSNFHTKYEALPNGDVKRTYYDAPNKIYSEYILKRVSRLSPDQISYEQEYQNDRQFVVLTKVGNRYKVLSNRSQSGNQLVENGKFAKDSPGTLGKETPWQTRCGD